jgi:hypothetical protein
MQYFSNIPVQLINLSKMRVKQYCNSFFLRCVPLETPKVQGILDEPNTY